MYEVFKDKKYVLKLIIFGSARTDFFNTYSSDIDIAVRILDSSYQSLVYEKVRNSVSRNFDIIFLNDLDEAKDYLLIEEINKGIDLFNVVETISKTSTDNYENLIYKRLTEESISESDVIAYINKIYSYIPPARHNFYGKTKLERVYNFLNKYFKEYHRE